MKWIALLAMTCIVACGGGGDTSLADLNASVHFTGLQFEIENKDARAWTDVRLEINGGLVPGSGYVLNVDAVKPGTTYTVGAMQFAKSDGTRFNPLQTKPQKFVITATVDSSGRKGMYVGGWK